VTLNDRERRKTRLKKGPIGSKPTKNRNIWLFRLVLVLCSQLFVVGGLEIGARLVGYGYPTQFFEISKVEGGKVVSANHQFFWSFFPRALSRSPQAFQFVKEKSPRSRRIFLFGESAAMGDPEATFGPARVLEWMLNQRHPDESFEVINLAVTAINSHVILPIAREATEFGADIWCLYMGNNEVHGQFGPGTVFGQSTGNLGLIRSSLAIKRTRLGQLANDLSGLFSGSSAQSAEWGGMSMFANRQVFADDARLQGVYENFRANLVDILSAGLAANAQVLVGTVAVNLRGSSPFSSEVPASLPAEQEAAWKAHLEAGRIFFEADRFEDALDRYQKAIDIFGGHADSHHQLGECHWQLQDFAAARKAFLQARDLDGLRFRTDSRLNDIIRKVAEEHASPRVHLVNAEALVSFNAPNGIPGDELFWDHVHFRFPGAYLVALAFAREIESILYSPETIKGLKPWRSLGECAQALTLTHWSDYQMTETMRQRLQEEPFRSQRIHGARNARLRSELEQHRMGISPEAFPGQQKLFVDALKQSPDDYVLRDLYARFLISHRRTEEAAEEWTQIANQVPSHLMAHYQKGNALAKDPARAKEAETSLRQALTIRPATLHILTALATALSSQGRHDEALRELDKALDLHPGSIDTLLAKSWVLAQANRSSEARSLLETARRLAPNDPRVAEANAGLESR